MITFYDLNGWSSSFQLTMFVYWSKQQLMQVLFTAFVDVSPEETMEKSPFENFEDVIETSSPKDVSVCSWASVWGCCGVYLFP